MKSVTGKRAGAGSVKANGMHLETAQNGVIAHLHMPMSKQGKEPMFTPPPEPTVHTTMQGLQDHVAKHLGHVFGTADAKTKGGGRVTDSANNMDLPEVK